MIIWPFKRRNRSTTEAKRQTSDDLRTCSPSINWDFLRRKCAQRIENGPTVTYSPNSAHNECILSNDTGDSPMLIHHQFQHYSQRNRISSSAVEHNRSTMKPGTSSTSFHLPHKKSSFVRRFSSRRKDTAKSRTLSPYESHLDRLHYDIQPPLFLLTQENDRPLSSGSTAPRASVESQMLSRAYKIRSFDVFSPHPTLRYDGASSPTSYESRYREVPSLTPSRSNSRRTNSRATQDWRYKRQLISVENLGNHVSRVDDLVNELDTKGLWEAMERDQRRCEKKRKEYEEWLQLKHERRELQHILKGDTGLKMKSHDMEQHLHDSLGESSAADKRDARIGHSVTRTQNDDSVDDVGKGVSRFSRKPAVVTPISPNPREEYCEQETRVSLKEEMASVEDTPTVAVDRALSFQAKTSTWTSFIKRATAARIKKEHDTSSILTEQPKLFAYSKREDFGHVPHQADRGTNLDVEDLRHYKGQTPCRHIPSEVVLAMNALETGHIQQKVCRENEYKDEMRDSVLPTPCLETYHHNESQINSKSFLVHPDLGLPGVIPKNISPFEECIDSRTVPIHQPQRYSSGAASLENGSRSILSTSLASIDSEGSWLSGKVCPRLSVQQIAPLRASVSSLRKRYYESDDHNVSMDDGYFTGVQKTHPEKSAGEESGGARLVIHDTNNDAQADMFNCEIEPNLWRNGMRTRVELRKGARAKSREAMLDDFNQYQPTDDKNEGYHFASPPQDIYEPASGIQHRLAETPGRNTVYRF
ncbi:hypothetical protein BDD12DRAFT_201221 [Trichophaea hybrida]|nr:hypothetical protein BDD12DRAFT_201221 [Trichophaea hybrida]